MADGQALREWLATGGATLVLLPLGWLLRAVVGLDDAELAAGFLTFHAAFVINDPHFAATYLLFYRRSARAAFDAGTSLPQRIRLFVAGFLAPAVLLAWAAYALVARSAQALGLMAQLMYALVGWHYVKQGYGVLAVLSARRGVFVSPRERVALLAHCLSGWVFAWANPSTKAGYFEERGVVYWAFARPRWLELGAGAVLAVTTIVLAAVLATSRRREGRFLPIGPLSGMLVSVWAWTILSAADPVMRYLIPALHSVQYLYFAGLLRRNEVRAREEAPELGSAVGLRIATLFVSAVALGFALFHGIPGLLDAALVPHRRGQSPGPLGPTPFLAAFYVVVNLHHFVMDHALWRRENPEMAHLRAS